MPVTKYCKVCDRTLPIDNFYTDLSMRDGYRNDCKRCRNDKQNARVRLRYATEPGYREMRTSMAKRYLHERGGAAMRVAASQKRKYGMTYEEATDWFGHKCWICGAGDERTRLHIDHCHLTGIVRGLLCLQHNTALGLFGDDVNLLLRAVTYLEGS